MKFKNIAEAFNYYKDYTDEQIEKRAQEIKGMIETDPEVDINSLNIELTALNQVKENNADRAQGMSQRGQALDTLKILTGGNLAGAKRFDPETVIDSPEYRSAFFKNMLGREMTSEERSAWNEGVKYAEKRADAFTASTDTGLAVIPTQTLNEIVKRARTIGGLMGEARHFAVPANIAIPIGTVNSKASWHTEGASVDTDEVVPTAVTFGGYEIIKIFSLSAKVRKMSISAFESYLVEELTNCVMETIADALVNGTGSGQGTGLESITWVTSGDGQNCVESAYTRYRYSQIIDTIALLKRGYAQGAKWAMNNATLYRDIYGMTDSNGRPIFIADPKNESVGRILGHEVIVDDNIADSDIYFGDFKKYLGYNMPEGIAIEVSTQSSFKKGLIDYRALAIADTKPILAEAFVKLTKAENAVEPTEGE